MARLWFNVDIKGQFSQSWPAFILSVLPTGKPERGPYPSFPTQVNQLERQPCRIVSLLLFFSTDFHFLLPSYCLQQGFLPSEIPMPSPNAISPSGLKSSSQFYSYEGSNPRRRSPQEPIGKIVKGHFLDMADEHHFKCIQVDLSLCLPSLLRMRFYKEISLPLD